MDDEKVTLSGNPPESLETPGAPAPIDSNTGMHKDYWTLSEEERSKGLVRPLRYSYIHQSCHTLTKMSRPLAETYARDPKFYGSTFCVSCRKHYPVGEFVWDGTSEVVGS